MVKTQQGSRASAILVRARLRMVSRRQELTAKRTENEIQVNARETRVNRDRVSRDKVSRDKVSRDKVSRG